MYSHKLRTGQSKARARSASSGGSVCRLTTWSLQGKSVTKTKTSLARFLFIVSLTYVERDQLNENSLYSVVLNY